MTAARRLRKRERFAFFPTAALGLLVMAGVPCGFAATTEMIVVDRNRGLALNGFDPVGYFTDGKPLLGREELEYAFAGAVWRFRNEGNRAAFAEHPEVYLPVFGGHDPVAVARGVATPGHPQIWLVTGERLYLFYDDKARETFAAEPEAVISAAELKWPDVMRTLSP